MIFVKITRREEGFLILTSGSWCSTAWGWQLQLRSLEPKPGLLSPLSRHQATGAGGSVASSEHAHKPGPKPETRHVAAPSCLLSISLPDFFQYPKGNKTAFFCMSSVSTHQISMHWSSHIVTWQFLEWKPVIIYCYKPSQFSWFCVCVFLFVCFVLFVCLFSVFSCFLLLPAPFTSLGLLIC